MENSKDKNNPNATETHPLPGLAPDKIWPDVFYFLIVVFLGGIVGYSIAYFKYVPYVNEDINTSYSEAQGDWLITDTPTGFQMGPTYKPTQTPAASPTISITEIPISLAPESPTPTLPISQSSSLSTTTQQVTVEPTPTLTP